MAGLDTLRSEYLKATAILGQFAKLAVCRLLGTRAETNGGSKAVRSLEDARLQFRVELTALSRLLMEKGVITEAEFMAAVIEEARAKTAELRREWPEVLDVEPRGIQLDVQKMLERSTREGWPP